MISRWTYYFGLAIRDLFRLWTTTQHHVIIVAGICLPILMLLGIKRGHVESLRQDLITSPTGRQVTFWSAQKGELMDRTSVERLSKELASIEVIIPETQRIVRLKFKEGENVRTAETVTLYATRPGDPLLKQISIDAPKSGGREIIVGQAVAEQLKATVGSTVDIVLIRGRGDKEETVEVQCQISAIMQTPELDASIGYADLDLLDQFDAFGRGFRVENLGWPSAKVSAADSYASYLFFCETGNSFSESDRKMMSERGFRIKDITNEPPSYLKQLLVPEYSKKLLIYEVSSESSGKDPKSRLRIAPSELSVATDADDVVLPWNSAVKSEVHGTQVEMVGISLPRRTWLREYFINREIPFDYDAEPRSFRLAQPEAKFTSIKWPLKQDLSIELAAKAPDVKVENPKSKNAETSKPDSTGPKLEAKKADPKKVQSKSLKDELQVLVVPTNLLAWIHAFNDGQLDFDKDISLFVPKPHPAIYDRARLYASTIDDVPEVVKKLAADGFAVMSETGRITEIHKQDISLQLLVWVVGLGVFLFGIVTVVSVLMDSTDRKRVTIGILRVMGMSRAGIFASILLRATAIGAAAAVLSVLCGVGLSYLLGWIPPAEIGWLSWKPIVSVRIDQDDLILVATGAMLCCGLGAIPPAWKASNLDPFDAIVEGRFR